jgi:hypothetical protein
MVVYSPNKFTFNVNYTDENGNGQTEKVKEGNQIQLNLNNGSGVQSVTIDDSVDLAEYAPAKQGQTFKGWKTNGNNTFSAEYESSVAAIAITNTRRSLSD